MGRSSRLLAAFVGLCLCGWFSKPPAKSMSGGSLGVLPNPLLLQTLGRSQIDFVADLYWIRMANMAGTALTSAECSALLPIGNLIADLSPRFKYPYFVGGVLAPFHRRSTKEYENARGAVALMARGVVAVPDYVRLHVQKAFAELEMLHDPGSAAKTLRIAAMIPGAPSFLSGLATRLLAQSGQYEEAREFALSMALSPDPEVSADFELRVKHIDLEQTLSRVEDAVQRFHDDHGRPPAGVDELLAQGYLSEPPVDPFGGTIELSASGPRSTSDVGRLRVFEPVGE